LRCRGVGASGQTGFAKGAPFAGTDTPGKPFTPVPCRVCHIGRPQQGKRISNTRNKVPFMPLVRVSQEVFEALDEIKWVKRFRSMNAAVEYILGECGVEPFDEMSEE